MKIRQGRRAKKRLEERKALHTGTRREGRTPPGSQNPHKGRGAKGK